MKIALLVFPLHYSHGCILQTYALYSKLKEFEYDVTILDRQQNKQPLVRLILSTAKRIFRAIFLGYRGAIFYTGWYPKSIMKEQNSFIDGFRKDIISVASTEELKIRVEEGRYDVIVVGSDQTWRPRYVPNVMDYWLDFASKMKVKKVAYAPSFGIDVWEYSEFQTETCKKLAALFDGISVREESGMHLCKEKLGIETKCVLDPTMLWDKAFYIPIAEKCKIQTGGCQCYFLDRTPEKEAVASKIAEIKELSVNYVNSKTENSNAPIKERIAPGIERWLAGFLNGDFIVVDSYHAMVFCIIFQKPFIVIGNKQRGLTRFESLLRELDLLDRLVPEGGDFEEIISKDIDWISVNKHLNNHRISSINFRKSSLNLK